MITQEKFDALPAEEKTKAIEAYDETERVWWGICQRCRVKVRGTKRELREHKCDPAE